jgi:CubicO group peptidase (beta-lactamase class C family)
MKSRLIAALLSCCLMPLVSAAADPPAARPFNARIDAVIDRALSNHRLVGVIVLVARDGKLIYQRAAGFADRESLRPVQADTLFRLASVSKPIVEASALALVDRGRLSLDDPLTRWLPQFRPKLRAGAAPTITIRQLLNHTSGLGYGYSESPGGAYHRAGISDGLDMPGLSMSENLHRLASVPLLSAPGTAWHDSLSTDVLGAVIEKVTHEPLRAAVRELVTGPLSMSDTDFRARDVTRLATPYVNRDPAPAPARMVDPQTVAYPPDVSLGSTAGLTFSPARALDSRSYSSGGAGLIGSASDVLTFLETIRQGGGRMLSPASARAMMVDQIGSLPGVPYGRGWEFGLGGAVLVDPEAAHSPQGIGTWRWGGEYGAVWFVDPTRNITLVSLSNTMPAGVRSPYVDELIDAVYD